MPPDTPPSTLDLDAVVRLAGDVESDAPVRQAMALAALGQSLRTTYDVYRLVLECRERGSCEGSRAAIAVLAASTGDRWFPCTECGAPVGTGSFAECHGWIHCPICGGPSRGDEPGCDHVLGWWCEEIGGLFVGGRNSSRIEGTLNDPEFPDEIPADVVAAFGDAWSFVEDYCAGWQDALDRYHGFVEGHTSEDHMTGALLYATANVDGVRTMQYDPFGASPASGIADYFYAEDADARVRAVAEIDRLLACLEQGLRLVIADQSEVDGPSPAAVGQ